MGLGRRFAGDELCEACQAKKDAAQKAAASRRAKHLAPYRREIVDALADEHLTEAEEQALGQSPAAKALSLKDLTVVLTEYSGRLLAARANAGRLPPPITSVILMVRDGEEAYLDQTASLMKEVTHREVRGGYGGVSIPITTGVRFNTGAYRGKSVVTGTSIEVADSGILTLTSRRVVFQGASKTVELDLHKLLGVGIFDDAVQFHVSNRQTAPLFKTPDGHLVAAVVNAAFQKL